MKTCFHATNKRNSAHPKLGVTTSSLRNSKCFEIVIVLHVQKLDIEITNESSAQSCLNILSLFSAKISQKYVRMQSSKPSLIAEISSYVNNIFSDVFDLIKLVRLYHLHDYTLRSDLFNTIVYF